MNEKRKKDISEKTSEKHFTFSGAMIKLGAYASYSMIFLLKKFVRMLCSVVLAFSSGIAALVRGVINKFKNAGRIIASPFVSCMKHGQNDKKENTARTDITVGSIRTTGFRQFITKTVHFAVPVAALTAFAFVLANASEIDRQISHRATIENNAYVPDFTEAFTETVTEAETEALQLTETELVSETEAVFAAADDDTEKADFVGVFADGELIGCLEDDTELRKFLESNLENVRNQPEVVDAEYKSNIEYVRGRYSKDKLTDTDTVIKSLGTEKSAATYTAEEGDMLYWIAEDNDLTLEELLALNPDIAEDPDIFTAGTELVISTCGYDIPVIITREAEQHSVIPFETVVKESDYLESGETELISFGENGDELTRLYIKYDGSKEISREIISTEIISEPVDEVISAGVISEPSEAYPDSDETVFNGNGMFMWPVDGGEVSEYFEDNDRGLGISAYSGSSVYAAADGVVAAAGWNTGEYGYFVVIDHGNGYKTLYANLGKVTAVKGASVKRGELIGKTGSSYRISDELFRFEIMKDGICTDPADYISE